MADPNPLTQLSDLYVRQRTDEIQFPDLSSPQETAICKVVGLLLLGIDGFLAIGFAEFELDLLALIKQSGAFIANGLQGQAPAEGFTDADGIRWLAIHLKNSKAI